MRPVFIGNQFNFGARKIDSGRHQIEPWYFGRYHSLGERTVAGQQFVARPHPVRMVHAKASRRIALRIKVDQQHAPAAGCQCGRDIDRSCGLAHPPFLIRNTDADHRLLSTFMLRPTRI